MNHQIKHRITGKVLFEGEFATIRDCVIAAVKAGADLTGAYLAYANLAGAINVPSGTIQTNPPDPYDHKQIAQRRAERAARYCATHPEVPVVEALDAKILRVIESGAGKLRMDTWHTCATTHCRAGWAITLAGEAGAELGAELEAKHGPYRAGMMIYRASTGHALARFDAVDEGET